MSTHTPAIPPNIPTMNIINSINVLEDVGNIYEAIRLAEDPAGDVKKNITQINTYNHIRFYTYCVHISRIPDSPSILIIELHVTKSSCFLPILSNRGPIIRVLIKLDSDKGSINMLISDCPKWNLFYKMAGNL